MGVLPVVDVVPASGPGGAAVPEPGAAPGAAGALGAGAAPGAPGAPVSLPEVGSPGGAAAAPADEPGGGEAGAAAKSLLASWATCAMFIDTSTVWPPRSIVTVALFAD